MCMSWKIGQIIIINIMNCASHITNLNKTHKASSTIIMTMMMLMITTNRFEWTILVLAITSLGLKHDADVDSLKVLPHHR